ncbi:MAG: hypothetical protein WBB45_10530 [Cyclobacteriaceae bacterium]
MNLESLTVEGFVTESNLKSGAGDSNKPTIVTYGYWSWCCGDNSTA